jgi:hypothetical protein
MKEKKIYHRYQEMATKYYGLRNYLDITVFLKGTLTNYRNFEDMILEFSQADECSPDEKVLIEEFVRLHEYVKVRIFCILLSKRGVFLHVKNLLKN